MKPKQSMITCLAIAFVLLVMTVSTVALNHAGGGETQITNYGSPPYEQYFTPAISGNKIVWVNNGDIWVFDGTETRITNDPPSQNDPDIYGDRIVWEENKDIYMYDLYTETKTQITNDTNRFQIYPAISANYIVWEEYDIANSMNRDIWMYDCCTGRLTGIACDPASAQSHPDISGDIIVWKDFRNWNADIYMYDIATGTEMPVCTNISEQRFPAISGDRIVWEDRRNGNFDIYMYDISTGTETVICDLPDSQERPAISGNLVVFQHWHSGGPYNIGEFDIYMSGGGETLIVCDEDNHQYYPAISGNRIVWEDHRTDDGRYSSIYLFTLFSQSNATVESSDAVGNKKDIFFTSDEVYAIGSGYEENKTYDLYIVEDRLWNDGMTIPPFKVNTSVSTDADGNISPHPTRIWSSGEIGEYDIIVDVNGNGTFDEYVDVFYGNMDVECDVIPEFTTIAIPVAAILGLLFFFNYRKRRKGQETK